MKTIVYTEPGFVRLDEVDESGCAASTTYIAPGLEGEDLLAWARAKTPGSESVDFPTAAVKSKKKKE